MVTIFSNKIIISNRISIFWNIDGAFNATITGQQTDTFNSYDNLILDNVIITFTPYIGGTFAGGAGTIRLTQGQFEIHPGDLMSDIFLRHNTNDFLPFNIPNLNNQLNLIPLNIPIIASQLENIYLFSVTLITNNQQADLQTIINNYTNTRYATALTGVRELGYIINYGLFLSKPDFKYSSDSRISR